MKKRELGLDILRTIAIIFVISVHFFLNNGFYSQKMEGLSMWAAGCFRWLFFSCVPLFLLITGYLRANDTPSKKYYCGLFRVLISWLIISVINIFFRIGYYGTEKSLAQWIGDILDFKAANYSWYVEMYIGVFLLLPFINLAFNSLGTKKGHQLMLGSICVLTFLPSFLNGWEIGGSVWNFVPNYWTALYPLGYYLIGCYIRKYQPKVPCGICLLLVGILCLFKGTLTYITADGQKFSDGIGGGYSDGCVCLISLLLFLAFYSESDDAFKGRIGAAVSRMFRWIAGVSFEAYLISWVFDVPLYDRWKGQIFPGTYLRAYLCVCVPVMVLSFLAAYPVSRISGWLSGRLKRCLEVF